MKSQVDGMPFNEAKIKCTHYILPVHSSVEMNFKTNKFNGLYLE